MSNLLGRIALVTGAASGIGKASAQALAAAGAVVVLSDINAAEGEAVSAAMRAGGAQADFMAADISNGADVQRLIEDIVARHGRLDIAHNNAGSETPQGPLQEIDEAEFDQGIAVNLKGVWLCMRAELRQMLAQGGGCIINTASQGGLRAVPFNATYCAAKHGVIGLTKTAAYENACNNITVNAICPGLTRTGMTERLERDAPAMVATLLPPMQRMGTPEEMAALVVFLASDGACFITGQALSADGGATAI